MTANRTRKTAAKRPARAPRKPTDHQPKAVAVEQEPAPLGFDVDTAMVLKLLGVEPGMVKEGSTRISLVENKVLIEYSILRAIPPRMMGMALLGGAASAEEQTKEQAGEDDSSG